MHAGTVNLPDDTYTHGHHESVLRSHRWRTAENSAAHLLPHLRDGMEVLDVGCGPGTITVDLARRIGRGRVEGVDRSEEIVSTARADAAGVENVSFTTGDVYRLDHPDETFDVVHAHQVLQHLSDPVGALREMRRVCRPGGLVAVRDADYGAFTWVPADPRLDRWLQIYRDVARLNGAEPDAGRFLLGWAQQAGFADIEPSASVWCFATPADRQWWGGLWADRVVHSSLAEQAVAAKLTTAADLDDFADAFRTWAEQPDGWFAVLHGELVARR